MSEQLIQLFNKLKYLREYLVKIGPERRKKEIAYKKLEEANYEYSRLEDIVTQLNNEIKIKKPSSETLENYKEIIENIRSIFSKIKLLLSMVDSNSQTDPEIEIMAKSFDIRTAISLLPVMNGQEQVTKQLVDGILLYSSLISEETQCQLIEFVLKTRLSSSAKLRLKGTYSNVTDLVQDIRRFLLPKKSTEALQSQLFRTKQGRRSIEAFGNELEELFVNLTLAQSDEDSAKFEVLRPLNEKTAIKRFADGLSDSRLSTIIASRQFTSLPDAIRVALDENTMSSHEQNQVMQFRPSGYNRGSFHYKRSSRGRTNNFSYQSSNNSQSNYKGNKGHRTPFVNTGHRGRGANASRQQSRGGRANFPRVQHSTRELDAQENLRNTDENNEFFRS